MGVGASNIIVVSQSVRPAPPPRSGAFGREVQLDRS